MEIDQEIKILAETKIFSYEQFVLINSFINKLRNQKDFIKTKNAGQLLQYRNSCIITLNSQYGKL